VRVGIRGDVSLKAGAERNPMDEKVEEPRESKKWSKKGVRKIFVRAKK